MLFDNFKPKYNLKKLQSLRKAHSGHAEHDVVCTACQKPLTNEESATAGMGLICRERARFSELVPREELPLIEGPQEPMEKGLYPARTAILRVHQQPPMFVTVLSVDREESLFIDRTEMNRVYLQTGSMAQAIKNSIRTFNPEEGDSIAPTSQPQTVETVKKFKDFQRVIRNDLRERMEFLASNPFDGYYTSVTSLKTLTPRQRSAREQILSLKETNPETFNQHWAHGDFHLATFMARLNFTHLPEAKLLQKAIGQNHGEIKGFDYGLLESEIKTGMQHAHLKAESSLFKAFGEGNRNLLLMIEIYKRKNDLPAHDVTQKLHILADNMQLPEASKPELIKFLTHYKISTRLLY